MMQRKWGVAWPTVAGVVLLLAGCADRAATATSPAAGVLPTERCGDYFIAEVFIEGAGPFALTLDTGASITTIEPHVARAAGVRSRIGKLEIGPLRITGRIRCQVRELDHLTVALGADIDGILGHQVFAKVLLTYDYPAGEIRYRIGRLTDDLPGVAPMSTGKRPFIGARVGERKINVLLDTGSNRGLSLRGFDRLDFATAPAVVGARMRIDGPSLIHAGRLAEDVQFGALTLRMPIVSNAVGDNLLGHAILSDFVVTLDQQRGRVQIVRPDGSALDEPLETPALRGTGLAVVPEPEAYVVKRVLPGTPAAEVGLRIGDRVVAVDGEQVSERGCPEPGAAAERVEPVRLDVQRGGELINVEVNSAVLVE